MGFEYRIRGHLSAALLDELHVEGLFVRVVQPSDNGYDRLTWELRRDEGFPEAWVQLADDGCYLCENGAVDVLALLVRLALRAGPITVEEL